MQENIADPELMNKYQGIIYSLVVYNKNSSAYINGKYQDEVRELIIKELYDITIQKSIPRGAPFSDKTRFVDYDTLNYPYLSEVEVNCFWKILKALFRKNNLAYPQIIRNKETLH